MSNRKNYNSIVFLTTLSVYLGLVLVGGATPQVLARAALTRDFDIKNEIEFKDDLDNKPDGEEVERLRELDIAQALITFAEDLQKLRSIGKYSPGVDINFSKQNTYGLGRNSKQVPPNEWMSLAADEFFERLFRKNFEKLTDKVKSESNEDYFVTTSKFIVTLDKSGFELRIEFNKDNQQVADALVANLNHLFRLKSDEAPNQQVKLIYENTKAASENNQVFVVTRLPRASIDELFAQKVAQ